MFSTSREVRRFMQGIAVGSCTVVAGIALGIVILTAHTEPLYQASRPLALPDSQTPSGPSAFVDTMPNLQTMPPTDKPSEIILVYDSFLRSCVPLQISLSKNGPTIENVPLGVVKTIFDQARAAAAADLTGVTASRPEDKNRPLLRCVPPQAGFLKG